MNILIKLFFVVLAIGGIILIFYVSWFWRALITPMVLILLFDVFGSFLGKKKV
ncbi:MAG: hypothetical protein UT84_C0049G0004 [Candidatus Curtissbacteria bacterium GW2011_GWA1_40_16]|uniref:Uncharacterized protein n=1 Tax=Candidatus Curtissbacteria bacterium GW2011_GWA1_40_16 TaxID=1618405 RepID=A0A0G0RE09_9BACT|nr:MAG: hypothetical protein UT84_C0049G0004 [Candidatus Curtissbacteria bacterium GW2011_GWA1_40_16]